LVPQTGRMSDLIPLVVTVVVALVVALTHASPHRR
jgi:hypothetical protein